MSKDFAERSGTLRFPRPNDMFVNAWASNIGERQDAAIGDVAMTSLDASAARRKGVVSDITTRHVEGLEIRIE